MMKAIVTAVLSDGANKGYPGQPVFRFRGEDGTWAWTLQLPTERLAVGDIVDVDGGWEWLDDNEQEAKLAAVARKTPAQRKVALVRQAEKLDKLELRHDPKTAAQLDREINEALGVFRRKKRP